MADFAKIHVRNTRFSVNRSVVMFFKVSIDEQGTWADLVKALQKRRNTGTQVETFLYLVKKYAGQKQTVSGLLRNGRFTVGRNKGINFKISNEELALWNVKLANHGGSKVECFMDMVNAEFTFQDNLEVITA